jgi:hypothetical protein
MTALLRILGRTTATMKEIYVRNILKLATISAALVTTITAASAQTLTRGYYDQSPRYGNSEMMMTGPAYGYGYGSDVNGGPLPYRPEAHPSFLASPGSQDERDINGLGG